MRKSIILLILMLSFFLFQTPLVCATSDLDDGVSRLAGQISNSMFTYKKARIAVVPFTNLDGTSSAFGQYLAEELITRLFMIGPGKFTLVERSQLQKVFNELGLQLSDAVDKSTAKRLGKVLGVDAIVTGSIADLGNTMKVNARMIDTETARIFAVAGTEIPKVGMGSPGQGKGKNLVKNGSFNQPWNTEWKRLIGDLQKGTNRIKSIIGPNGKNFLHLYHEGKSHMLLYQEILIENIDLLFTISFKPHSWEGPLKAFSGTGMAIIELQYQDQKGNHLGSTQIFNYVKNPFADSAFVGVPRLSPGTSTLQRIKVNPQWYYNYLIDVHDEIVNNLPGIDIKRVKSIAVVLYVGATHPRAGAELTVGEIELRYK